MFRFLCFFFINCFMLFVLSVLLENCCFNIIRWLSIMVDVVIFSFIGVFILWVMLVIILFNDVIFLFFIIWCWNWWSFFKVWISLVLVFFRVMVCWFIFFFSWLFSFWCCCFDCCCLIMYFCMWVSNILMVFIRILYFLIL